MSCQSTPAQNLPGLFLRQCPVSAFSQCLSVPPHQC
ncbi:unnamed protein product, partial [Staurois parvus]